jgi:myo-inositol-1-phosphate synthase
MLERSRLASKKISKTDAVRSQLAHDMAAEDIHIGPSDYVPWLNDRKWAHIRLEGRSFGDQPINVELKLEVWDSPNSAGVVIDAVRCAKLGLDNGLKGALIAPCSYFKKSPPYQFPDETARELTEAFIKDPKAVERRLRDHEMPTVRREGKPLKKAGPSMNGGTTGRVAAKNTAAPARPTTRAPRSAKKRRKAVAR